MALLVLTLILAVSVQSSAVLSVKPGVQFKVRVLGAEISMTWARSSSVVVVVLVAEAGLLKLPNARKSTVRTANKTAGIRKSVREKSVKNQLYPPRDNCST